MKSFFKNEKQQPFEKEVKTKEKPNNQLPGGSLKLNNYQLIK